MRFIRECGLVIRAAIGWSLIINGCILGLAIECLALGLFLVVMLACLILAGFGLGTAATLGVPGLLVLPTKERPQAVQEIIDEVVS